MQSMDEGKLRTRIKRISNVAKLKSFIAVSDDLIGWLLCAAPPVAPIRGFVETAAQTCLPMWLVGPTKGTSQASASPAVRN